MIVTILLLCLAIWVIYTYVLPSIPDPFKTILAVVVGIGIIVYVLGLAGIHIPGLNFGS